MVSLNRKAYEQPHAVAVGLLRLFDNIIEILAAVEALECVACMEHIPHQQAPFLNAAYKSLWDDLIVKTAALYDGDSFKQSPNCSINELRGDYEFNPGEVKVSRSMRHAYNGLIWPLAVSYLYATKGGFESVERKDNYLVLFEFISAFNFIILLSGLPDNVYQKYKWDIWDARNKKIYKDMTFGKWVRLSENIAQVYRNNNFTSKLEEELFNKISSNKILKILNKAKDFRNDESHGSHSNKYEADKVLDELNIYLEDIFDILDVYSNYKMIYVVENNDLNHRVILLNGPCAPPIYERITFDEKLEKERLYLYNPRNNKKLLIKDNFMKFVHLDDERKNWALFLYDSCDYPEYNATYKCYQSKEEPLECSIYDFIEDIIG